MSSRLVTIIQASLLFVAIGLSTYAALEAFRPRRVAPAVGPPATFQDGRGRAMGMGMRGMAEPERKLVATFDRDRDGILNATERAAALGSLQRDAEFARVGGNQGERAEAGMRIAPGSVRTYPDVPLYDAKVLRTIFLTFESQDWQRELASFYRTDVDVPATVVVDGRTYRDVGVRFRGNSSYRMVPYGLKHSLNLSFDFKNKDQELAGYKTLNLLNSNNDPTFMRTMLFGEIARHYVPTARTSFARVVINGESWGVYVNVEQVNNRFVREWFEQRERSGASGEARAQRRELVGVQGAPTIQKTGLRWKVPGSPHARGGLEYLGDAAEPYKTHYEIKSKDEPASWAALAKLCKVLNETPASQLPAALEPILDVDGVLKFLAIDVALVNTDGYWTRASDYNIYRDGSGRFHIFPHDFNEAFGPEEGRRGRGFMEAGTDLNPMIGLDDEAKPLRSRLLAVPQWRERYLRYVHEIAERWLDWETLNPMIREWQALIEADVKSDTKKIYSTDGFYGDSLREFVERRRAFLLQ
jgi:spore coat protein CotH